MFLTLFHIHTEYVLLFSERDVQRSSEMELRARFLTGRCLNGHLALSQTLDRRRSLDWEIVGWGVEKARVSLSSKVRGDPCLFAWCVPWPMLWSVACISGKCYEHRIWSVIWREREWERDGKLLIWCSVPLRKDCVYIMTNEIDRLHDHRWMTHVDRRVSVMWIDLFRTHEAWKGHW